jgi:hypothetical protein
VTIQNDRPVITTQPFAIEKSGMEQIPYSVQIYDPDGIERVQIDMGVFSPVGQTSWVRMYDDGTNGGDEVANDGVFTALLSVRTGTPIGTHEIQLRALDQFGELNTTTASIVLKEASSDTDDSGGLSTTVLTGLGAILLLGAGLVLFFMTRNQGKDGDKADRFGMQ